jgi:hypothetical protein
MIELHHMNFRGYLATNVIRTGLLRRTEKDVGIGVVEYPKELFRLSSVRNYGYCKANFLNHAI